MGRSTFEANKVVKVDLYPANGTEHLERIRIALGLHSLTEAANVLLCVSGKQLADTFEAMHSSGRGELYKTLNYLMSEARLKTKGKRTVRRLHQGDYQPARPPTVSSQSTPETKRLSTPVAPPSPPPAPPPQASPSPSTISRFGMDEDDEPASIPTKTSALDRLSSL